MTNEFSSEVLGEAEKHPSLGPVYFESRNIARRYMKHFEESHLAPLADMIGKEVRDRIWQDIDVWLLMDTESNLRGQCQRLAEQIVVALLNPERQPAIDESFLLGSGFDAAQIRQKLVALMGDHIMAKRVEELEAENTRLKEALSYR